MTDLINESLRQIADTMNIRLALRLNTGSEAELLQPISGAWQKIYARSLPTQPMRRRERLCAAAMVAEMLGGEYGIGHDDAGRPYACLAGSAQAVGCLTVSHSKTFVAVGWSETPLGIDLECTTDRPLRLASRFLHKDEMSLIDRLPYSAQTAALMLWTAKEAAFKRFSRQGATTLSDLVLQMDDEGQTTALYDGDTASLTFVVEKEWTMCVCV